ISDYDADRVDRTALAWFEAYYARRYEPVADALDFDSPPGGGSVIYDIGPLDLDPATPPRVFDVTDPLAPVEILRGTYPAGLLTYARAACAHLAARGATPPASRPRAHAAAPPGPRRAALPPRPPPCSSFARACGWRPTRRRRGAARGRQPKHHMSKLQSLT